jgi:Ion channel
VERRTAGALSARADAARRRRSGRAAAFASAAFYVIGAPLALVAPVVIVRRRRATMRITASTILGARCLYLLAGLYFASLFTLVGPVGQGPYFSRTSTAAGADYLSFGPVTLATLGYGDLTASSNLGKMLSATEALAGQHLPVSAVAVLVSNLERVPRRQSAGTPGQGDASGAASHRARRTVRRCVPRRRWRGRPHARG